MASTLDLEGGSTRRLSTRKEMKMQKMPGLVRCRLFFALAAPLLAGCGDNADTPAGLPAPQQALGRVTPGATFDWTVPDRFGLDENGDGLVDYPRTEEELNPSSWTVDFDACDITGGTRYIWHVDERQVAMVESCRYTHDFPAEGTYDVAVHVVFAPGSSVWAEEIVTVQDWLVVSFGDSYASGEGVPEIPQANDALFQSLNDAFQDLVDARRLRDQALQHLQDAIASKGLAQAALTQAQQELSAFLNACTITDFTDIQQCADFLTARALSFSLYDAAKSHFDQAVQNAQDRLNSAVAALNAAQQAFDAAVSAVQNLRSAIQALGNGFRPPVWQQAYANETWGGGDCHRSANAAPARAALALERSDPRTSVTFVHLACSGAKTDRGRADMHEQIRWAEELIGPREIDAVFVSIGGNDAGFAGIATACAGQQPCYATPPAFNPADASAVCSLLALVGYGQPCLDLFANLPSESAAEVLSNGLNGDPGSVPPEPSLAEKYATLATAVFPTLTGLLEPESAPPGRGTGVPPFNGVDRVRSDRIYITEYVDMTKDDALAYCTLDLTDPLGAIPGVTVDEMSWLDHTAAGSINTTVLNAASAHGWNYVSQIYDAYAPHGYCAVDHWVVRVHETFLRQGDHFGVAHPNNSGHAVNGQAILAALMPDLYPGGLLEPPRAPDHGNFRGP